MLEFILGGRFREKNWVLGGLAPNVMAVAPVPLCVDGSEFEVLNRYHYAEGHSGDV
jgi:hypothetical protein